MKKYIAIIFILFCVSCEDYVTNVDKPIELVHDDELNSESQIDFLIAGLKTAFSNTQDRLFGLSDGLSDQFISDPASNFISLIEIDNGEIEFDNNMVTSGFYDLGKLRFFADDLVRRIGKMDISDESVKNNSLFNGYLFGGIARYFSATYFGLTPTEGGSAINGGPFIPSVDMYDLAVEKLEIALQHTTDSYETRLVNSLIARAYLYKGDYNNATTYADFGLIEGDAPFEGLYTTIRGNFYFNLAGNNTSEYIVDKRFIEYINADPMEATRIQLAEIVVDSTTTLYYQVKYPDWTSSIPHITWQENNLMRAELALRGAGSGDALQLINDVRISHGLAELSEVNLKVLYEERDKELFCTGSRLPDQRRFNEWHLTADKWQYLPISQDERDRNPNFD